MSWLQVETVFLDVARVMFGFGLNWMLQSTFLIMMGLAIGCGLSRRGSAAQSVIYCTTLAAVLICPALTWAISNTGVTGWSFEMPRAWMTSQPIPLTTPQANPAPVVSIPQTMLLSHGNAELFDEELPDDSFPIKVSDAANLQRAELAPISNANDSTVFLSPKSLRHPHVAVTPAAPQKPVLVIQPFGLLAGATSLLWLAI